MTTSMLCERPLAHVPESHLDPVVVTVSDETGGLFTTGQLEALVWALWYQAMFHYNRSPLVERGASAPVADVRLLAPGETPKETETGLGYQHIELLATSDQPGALGYHEDSFDAHSTPGKARAHSSRGTTLEHPLAAGAETPLSKVFCKTAKDDGVPPSEVASHEMIEALFDPSVMDEAKIRAYKNPADGKEYIGEACDAEQGRGYDVGAPEGRPCHVEEAIVADFGYLRWWGQEQRRTAVCFTDDDEAWIETRIAPVDPAVNRAGFPRLAPFQVAAGGYMSVRDPGGEWTQI